jgi:hypothetical protein
MTNNKGYKFTEILWKYFTLNELDLNQAYDAIKDMHFKDFRRYYIMAKYNYNQKHLKFAYQDISKAIECSKKNIKKEWIVKDKNSLPFFAENCLSIFTRKGIPIDNPPKTLLYELAGEICSNLFSKYKEYKYYEESIEYYKIFQYHLSNGIKSQYDENKDKVVVYSFRKYNKYVLSDLINKQLTLCRPKMMNDPFDTIVMIWSEPERMAQTCKDKPHIIPYSKAFEYYRIRSFSIGENNDEDSPLKKILMWSHYADSHKGFCIKYEFKGKFLKNCDEKKLINIILKKSDYGDTPIKLNTKDIDLDLAFFRKYGIWENEYEVRLLSYNPTLDSDTESVPLDNDAQIKDIYFGLKFNEENISTIKNILGDTVKYHKMKINENNIYNLEIDDL